MKVAILGCGPAGLLAAQAVANAGHQPEIFSKPEKSKISGAQYLAAKIHNIEVEKFEVTFVKAGTGAGYTEKLYRGRDVPVVSSWHSYEEGRPYDAWPMQDVYDQLWGWYGAMVHPVSLNQAGLQELLRGYELVISTIPKHVIARSLLWDEFGSDKQFPDGWFESREIWVKTDGLPGIMAGMPDNTIFYNGFADGDMYRASHIRGNMSAEYVSEQEGAIRIVKPIRYGGPALSDDHPNLFFVGRYGAWSKMQLAHHAYFKTLNLLRPDLAVPA